MVKRALESKPEFQNIYTAFHEKIRRHLARLVGEADSEDVTQEVFLKVNAGLNDFRESARQVADIVLTELKKTGIGVTITLLKTRINNANQKRRRRGAPKI